MQLGVNDGHEQNLKHLSTEEHVKEGSRSRGLQNLPSDMGFSSDFRPNIHESYLSQAQTETGFYQERVSNFEPLSNILEKGGWEDGSFSRDRQQSKTFVNAYSSLQHCSVIDESYPNSQYSAMPHINQSDSSFPGNLDNQQAYMHRENNNGFNFSDQNLIAASSSSSKVTDYSCSGQLFPNFGTEQELSMTDNYFTDHPPSTSHNNIYSSFELNASEPDESVRTKSKTVKRDRMKKKEYENLSDEERLLRRKNLNYRCSRNYLQRKKDKDNFLSNEIANLEARNRNLTLRAEQIVREGTILICAMNEIEKNKNARKHQN